MQQTIEESPGRQSVGAMTDAAPSEQPKVSTPHSTTISRIRRRFVARIQATLKQENTKNREAACLPRRAPNELFTVVGATAHR